MCIQMTRHVSCVVMVTVTLVTWSKTQKSCCTEQTYHKSKCTGKRKFAYESKDEGEVGEGKSEREKESRQ